MKLLNSTNDSFEKKRVSAQPELINITNQQLDLKVLTQEEVREVKEQEEETFSSNSVIFNPDYPNAKHDVYLQESMLFETGLQTK